MNDSATASADLDLSRVTPELCAALAAAQQQAKTVGKDETNTQRGYNYASAEAMIRAARDAMGGHGLSVISTWSSVPVDSQPGDIGNQFVCATVTESFALLHEGGGMIIGRAVMDAIGSRARPTDKAVAATSTYMHGFVLRHLLNLDRAEEGKHSVDRREESDDFRTPNHGQRTVRKPDAKSKPDPMLELRRGAMTSAVNLIAIDPMWGSINESQGMPATVHAMREAAGVPTDGQLDEAGMRGLKSWCDERIAQADGAPSGEGPAVEFDKDTGEIKEPPLEYEAGDGFELESETK